MIYFFTIGPVSYPVAVFIRSTYFCALLMFDTTIITICLFRQLIILRVTINFKQLIDNFIQIYNCDFQPVWFCNLNHEKCFRITATLIASISSSYVFCNYIITILKHGIVLSKLEAFFMESNYDPEVLLNLYLQINPKIMGALFCFYLEMEETCDSCTCNKHLIKIHRIFPDIHFLLIQFCLLLEERIKKK